MQKILIHIFLAILVLSTSGCLFTHKLMHDVGNTHEIPKDEITSAYISGSILAINYIAILAPAGDRTTALETYDRQALFNLDNESKIYHRVIGQIQANANAIQFLPEKWNLVQCIPDNSGQPEERKEKPEVVLGNNSIVIRGTSPAWFQVIRQASLPNKIVTITQCELRPVEGTTWWKIPVQIIGFPFALATDIILSPLYVSGWILYVCVGGI